MKIRRSGSGLAITHSAVRLANTNVVLQDLTPSFARQGDLRAIRLVFELSGILQAQSARKLFNEDVYSDYFNADDTAEKLIQVMEERYTATQRLVIASTIRKILDDIDFIKVSFASEEIAIGENAQMQFNS